MQDKKYDYQGFHATADIVLKKYPDNSVETLKHVKESIKHSNLNIVDENIHDFGGAVTALWTLSESHFSLHEYPEDNYLTVDCYTCGKEGDPLAAVNNLIETLDKLFGVEKSNVKFIERGNFDEKKIHVQEFSDDIQNKLNNVTKSLTDEQLEDLKAVLKFVNVA